MLPLWTLSCVIFVLALGIGLPTWAGSTIDPTQPPAGVPYNSAPIRNDFQAAVNDVNGLLSKHSATVAPLLPTLGEEWLNTTTPTSELDNIYDGTSWLPMGALNTVTHVWTPYGGGSPLVTSCATADSVAYFSAVGMGVSCLPSGVGTSGQALVSNGPGVAPTWQTVATLPGTVADGVTDNCSAINSYISAATTTGIAITFGPGIYVIKCAITINNKSLTIRGAGKSSTTLLFSGGTDGFDINSSLNNTLDVADLSIQTADTTPSHNGIALIYTTNGFANRDTTKANFNNLSIKGQAQSTQSWNTCIAMTNVNYVHANNVDCLGTNGAAGTTGSTQAANTVTPFGMTIAGTGFPTDIKISNSLFQSLNKSIYADTTNMQGLQVLQSTFVNDGIGIHWFTGSANQGQPQLLAIGNNFNTYQAAIEATGINESVITKNLIYHNPGSTSGTTLVALQGVGSVSVQDNEFESFVLTATASTTGLSVASAVGYSVPASYLTTIADNMFGAQAAANSFATGISLLSGSTQELMRTNRCGSNVATCISNTSGTAPGQQTAPGRHMVSLKLSSSQSIPNNTATLVNWDTIAYETLNWTVATPPTTTITVPATAPFLFARCTAQVEFAANATGLRTGQILKNAAAAPGLPVQTLAAPSANAADVILAGTIVPVAASDAFTVSVSQNSGGALNLDPQNTWITCEAIE